jgi:hypothetical protein
MLDFYRHRRRTVRRAAGLPQQRRLVSLVLLSLGVVMMIGVSRNENLWRGLFGLRRAPPPAELPAERPPADPPGTFRAAPTEAKGEPATAEAPPADDAPSPQPSPKGRGSTAPATPTPPAARPPLPPGARADYLQTVEDDTVFRPAEADAWFHLLDLLKQPQIQKLAGEARRVSYAQLQRQPAAYRGQLVQVEGTARGAFYKKAPKNSYGITGYHQLWIEAKGGPPNPIVVYCLDVPQGFPSGEELDAQVSLAGFSYKRWAYESRGGITTAPVVLAAALNWQKPQPAAPAPQVELGSLLLIVLPAALGLCAMIVLLVWWRDRASTRQRHATTDPASTGAALAALAEAERSSAHLETTPDADDWNDWRNGSAAR